MAAETTAGIPDAETAYWIRMKSVMTAIRNLATVVTRTVSTKIARTATEDLQSRQSDPLPTEVPYLWISANA